MQVVIYETPQDSRTYVEVQYANTVCALRLVAWKNNPHTDGRSTEIHNVYEGTTTLHRARAGYAAAQGREHTR